MGAESAPPVPEDQKKPGLNRVKYIFAEKNPGYLTSFVPLLRGIPRNTKFLWEFKFADCRFFCVFCRNKFLRMGETFFSCWELVFVIFRKSPSVWNSNVVVF